MNKISSEKKSMLILSVGFGLVYLGMNGIVQHSVLCRSLGFRTCQSFSVKVLGSLGAYSMGLSYFVYSIANFFVPIFLIIFPDESFGLKLSALEYPLYLFTFVYVIPWLCLVWGAIHGITSAIFWGAQGVYLAKLCTNENRGKMTGNFWTIYMIGASTWALYVVLSMLFLTIIKAGGDSGWNGTISILFLVSVIGLLGCGILFFLPSLWTKTDQEMLLEPTTTSKKVNIQSNLHTIKTTFLNVFKYMVKKPILCLLPFFINLGYANIWIVSMLNREVEDAGMIGIYMSIYSLVEVLISYPQGYLSDHYGNSIVVYFSFVCEGVGLFVSFFAYSTQSLLCIVYILMALSDAIYNTQALTIIGNAFSIDDQAIVIAIFRMLQSFFGGVCYFISPLFLQNGETTATFPMYCMEVLLALFLLLLSLGGYILFERTQSIDSMTRP